MAFVVHLLSPPLSEYGSLSFSMLELHLQFFSYAVSPSTSFFFSSLCCACSCTERASTATGRHASFHTEYRPSSPLESRDRMCQGCLACTNPLAKHSTGYTPPLRGAEKEDEDEVLSIQCLFMKEIFECLIESATHSVSHNLIFN